MQHNGVFRSDFSSWLARKCHLRYQIHNSIRSFWRVPSTRNMASSVQHISVNFTQTARRYWEPSVRAMLILSDTQGSGCTRSPWGPIVIPIVNNEGLLRADVGRFHWEMQVFFPKWNGSRTRMCLAVHDQNPSQATHGPRFAARQKGVLEFQVLPFLRRCHQCWDLIIMVFPHRKAVQGLISTLRETERHIKVSNYDCGERRHSAALSSNRIDPNLNEDDTHTHRCIHMHNGQEWK